MDARKILRNEFKGINKVILAKLQNLSAHFNNICMKESESAKDLSSRVIAIVFKIGQCGDDIPNKRVVEKVFRRRPSNLNMLL